MHVLNELRQARSGYKWSKNAWRTVMVIICLVIAASTTSALDHFVAVTKPHPSPSPVPNPIPNPNPNNPHMLL